MLGIEDRDQPVHHADRARSGFLRGDPHAHVVATGLREDLGALERGATTPQSGGAGVARRRGPLLVEVVADEQRVLIDPRNGVLRDGHAEPAVDERPGDEVELADLRGVGAARRQADETAALLRLQTHHPVVRPRLALRLRQRIHVEHGFPFGIAREVLLP